MDIILNGLLIVVLVICMITDYRQRKIYNKVIFPSLIAGFLLNIIIYGFEGLKISALGFAMGFAFFIIPFALNWIGAGDLKLVMAIGAFKGYHFTINATLIIAAIGGFMSLIYVIKQKRFKQTMIKIGYFLTWIFVHKKNLSSYSEDMEKMTIPYGIAIGLGTIVAIIMEYNNLQILL